MKKTLLLCFIHGFKGGEDTFGYKFQFTEDLRRLVAARLPKIDVRVAVYPKYETRGDLHDCVSRFRDWLLEKVIDLEVAAHTPSPTIDPSVRVVLVGHSMGGIVAAETVIALTSDEPIPPPSAHSPGSSKKNAKDEQSSTRAPMSPHPALNSLMFPYVQGVLAFDTPFLGISPGVIAHGAEGHYSTASAALTQLSGLTGALWGGSAAASSSSQAATAPRRAPAGALPAPPPSEQKKAEEAGGGWGRWGRIAMYAGGAAAIAAGGAAAYLHREQITESWTWAASHLEFVGCLARGEELRRRVAYMARASRELGLGFGNLYTRLGRAATSSSASGSVGTVLLPGQRTFCNLPSRPGSGDWREAVNDAATDETGAHMSMFQPKENPGYKKLATDAASMVVAWTRNDWYESSFDSKGGIEA